MRRKFLADEGQILVLVIFIVAAVLASTLFIIGGAQLYYQNANYSSEAEKALNLAEAGLDKAIASFNELGASYSGDTEVLLGDGSFSVSITSKNVSTKIIVAAGYIPNKTKPRVTRKVAIEASQGVGVSFVYGVQVGEGGLQLGHGNTVTGSIYSNGDITADHDNTIKGEVWVAGGQQPNPDQQMDCSGVGCADYLFGKNVSGENRLDVTQSFKPSISNVLNKVSLKLKKIGNPSDVAVRIIGDDGGKPDKNNVLASGTLYSSLVTSSYGWIDVTFTSSPNLAANTTYWLMIDTSSNSSNYWSWQNDLSMGYSNGQPKWSPNWDTGNPNWNTINGDLSLQTYMGGVVTKIDGGQELEVKKDQLGYGGHAHANTIKNLEIEGDAYYQSISGSSVAGISYPGSPDPAPKVFPISDANIDQWKQDAACTTCSTYSNLGCVSTLGPGKVNGNVALGEGCIVTIKSPVWITGNLTGENNNKLTLDQSYTTTSGVIVVDGIVDIKNNNKVEGTGQGSSILMILSTYDSRTNGLSAIIIKNNGNTGVFYANKGIIEPGSNNNFKELTAWGIKLVNNSTIDYTVGLSSSLFTSGPSGSYTLVNGTYQVK